ncbi:SusD-like starch-binding protein associating with outer membrane [Chitinophaga skermanii]|uniref:SusD-like starch-binding protein associating with outer membrane n=1 Tax=Chitinophaga skermanii TaxID=331697 RepID=A0A327QPA4_9BACT|nr:RagB/SusD family nutrient uptake outer membrane protein [Chitinophaga skermanii]RAJ06466.1 SusD-like starch-binding protein associating with outer membrane [Chitinophaga skermanii]
MRTSTYFKYLLPICFFALLGSACKKGWLDETPSSQIRADQQFETEGGFRDALIGVYIGMTQPGYYSREMSWNIVDRLAMMYAPYAASNIYSEFQNYNYKATTSRSFIDNMWNYAYTDIANINNALKYIDERKQILDPINYNLIKGELLALRAYIHFDLVRLFGHSNFAGRPELAGKLAIPYATEYGKKIAPQLSYTDLFTKLEGDVNAALELLKKDDPIYAGNQHPKAYYSYVNSDGFYNNRNLRMNYYAALALKARLLQWQGSAAKMAAARDAANEVIQYAPAKLITNAPSGNTVLRGEDLFSLNVQAFNNLTDNFLTATDATNTFAVFMLQANAEELYETSQPEIGLADYRFNTMTSLQMRGRVPVKLRQDANSFDSRNRIPLIRISEMYYIAAEDYKQTNKAKAIEYLNTVRQARGILKDIAASASSDDIQTEITKEYRKEFVSEGQLFYYYKRRGFTTFPGLSAGKVANDELYMLPYPDNEIEFGGRVQ